MLDGQIETFPASGMIAGVIARTDSQRRRVESAGRHRRRAHGRSRPAGEHDRRREWTCSTRSASIACARCLSSAAWCGGARTLRGADAAADEYKYVPVRRTALFIEESLYRGLKWVVFEPNDEPLWAQIRLNVGAFMHNMFRQGAFQGKTPREAYLVKCDAETTRKTISTRRRQHPCGFAPLKPAEFVIIRLQQLAGQIQS